MLGPKLQLNLRLRGWLSKSPLATVGDQAWLLGEATFHHSTRLPGQRAFSSSAPADL